MMAKIGKLKFLKIAFLASETYSNGIIYANIVKEDQMGEDLPIQEGNLTVFSFSSFFRKKC